MFDTRESAILISRKVEGISFFFLFFLSLEEINALDLQLVQ